MKVYSDIVKSHLVILALVAVYLSFGNTAYARTQQIRSVLVINSFHPTKRWTRLTVEGIESTLEQYKGIINLDVEYMDTKYFNDEEHYQSLFNLYKHKADHKKYDVIIACGYNALYFILQHRRELYPGVPVVFCKIDHSSLPPDDHELVTGVTLEDNIFESTFELVLGLHPSAKKVVVLIEGQRFADLGRRTMALLAEVKQPTKLITYFLSNPTAEELVSKIKGLGQESIVVFTSKFTDTAQLEVFGDIGTMIEQQCQAPIYALSDLWFSHAPIVGGKFGSGFYHGQAAAELVMRILDGESANEIPIQHGSGDKYIFDYAQLKRFGIPFPKLPKGSVIINEPETLYYLYKKQIWAVISIFAAFGIMIVLLSANIIRRRLAKKKLLNYQSKLKSLASELSLTEERERRHIATVLHDQISQSLVISKVELDALREATSSGEFYNVLNEVCELLDQTIQSTKSLTFDLSSPILHELGLEKALADWLTEQIEKKYGIVSEFEDDGRPKHLDDDIRALLFRDVKKLLENIIKHASASKVKVCSRRVDGQIQISIEDNGVGFDVSKMISKPSGKGGFGLFSIRERLERSGGHLGIESEVGRGTMVTITAPLKMTKINNEE